MWTDYVTTAAGWRVRVFVSIRAVQFEGSEIVRLVPTEPTPWPVDVDTRDGRVTADKRAKLKADHRFNGES